MTVTDGPQATLANWRQHPHSVWGFTHVDSLLPVAPVAAGKAAALTRGADLDLSSVNLSWDGARMTAWQALAATHTDAFLVMKDGAVVAEHYVSQQPEDRHIVFSVSKSVTAALAGVLVEQGLLDPDAPVVQYLPEVKASAYGGCTLRHVLDMTVSIRFTEDYLDPLGDVARYRVAMGWNPPDATGGEHGLHSFIAGLTRADYPHGHRFHYVSPNSDLLGWVIERASGETFARLLSRHVWQPMGAAQEAFITLDRHGAPRTAGGICTSLADLARFGEVMRGRGAFNGRRIIPARWIDDILQAGDAAAWSRGELVSLFPQGRYRSKWYVPGPSSDVLCAIGIHGQWIYVDFDAGMVAVKQSSQPIPADDAMDHLTLALMRAIAGELRA